MVVFPARGSAHEVHFTTLERPVDEAPLQQMDLTLHIPDDIADRLRDVPHGGDLSRRALEGLALQELKAGHITEPELGRMLGLARVQIDGFLKSHGVYQDYTLEDFEKERAALKSLGL